MVNKIHLVVYRGRSRHELFFHVFHWFLLLYFISFSTELGWYQHPVLSCFLFCVCFIFFPLFSEWYDCKKRKQRSFEWLDNSNFIVIFEFATIASLWARISLLTSMIHEILATNKCLLHQVWPGGKWHSGIKYFKISSKPMKVARPNL